MIVKLSVIISILWVSLLIIDLITGNIALATIAIVGIVVSSGVGWYNHVMGR